MIIAANWHPDGDPEDLFKIILKYLKKLIDKSKLF